MAFNVNFWTFSKKERSTAQPSGTGTVYSCNANEPLDLLAPVISLKLALNTASPPTVYNYARIANFSRYYWVTGWEIRDGLWWASLRVDVLASWKTEIGNTSTYVYRAAAAFDGSLVDPVYPTVANYSRSNEALPKLWAVDGDTTVSRGYGIYVLGIIGSGNTVYYGFSKANLDTFLQNIFSDNYYSAVLGHFGATEFVEAKVALGPLQYISSIRFYPCFFGTPGTAYALHFNGVVSSVAVGPVSVSCSALTFAAVGAYPDLTSYNNLDFTLSIGSSFRHPQAASRGTYLNLSPYSSFEMFYPPFGNFELNPADLLNATGIKLDLAVDMRSGSGTLTVYAVYSASLSQIICRSTAQVGIDCPLSAVVQTGENNIRRGFQMLSDVWSMVKSGPAAFFGPGSVIGSAISGEIPHLSVAGSQGSGSNMGGDPCIQITHRYVVDDDNPDLGRPLCKIRTLNTLAGFQQADPDDMELPCTETEATEIRGYIRDGYFFE